MNVSMLNPIGRLNCMTTIVILPVIRSLVWDLVGNEKSPDALISVNSPQNNKWNYSTNMKNYICKKSKTCKTVYHCYHKIPHELSTELNCLNEQYIGTSDCSICRKMSEEEVIISTY
jgi:hypothetical protein